MYSVLSQCYNALVGADYPAMAEFYKAIWRQFGQDPQSVLDLGCGTGNLLPFLEEGRQVIGVDISPEMLAIAWEKAGPDTLLLCEDMTELDLFGTVDAAICALDGVNALPDARAVQQMFSRVNLFLSSGGLFIFDVNTPYKFEHILNQKAFVYDTDEVFLVWENEYDKRAGICDFLLTFFFPNPDGSYRREEECMSERAYTKEQLCGMVERSGLELLAVYGDGKAQPPSDEEQRIYFVTRKGRHAPNQ